MKKANNNEKLWVILSGVMFALLVLVEALLVFEIRNLQLLPGKYLLIVLAALAVVDVLVALLMRQHKRGKWQVEAGHKRKIIAAIISFVLIIGCLIGILAVSRLDQAIEAITDPSSSQNVMMNVYVPNDDPAQSIEDAANYTFGITTFINEAYNEAAIQQIQKDLGHDITVTSYEDLFSLIDAMFAGEVDAILLDETYVTVIEGMEGYDKFSIEARRIGEYITKKVAGETVPSEIITAPTETTAVPTEATVPIMEDVTNSPFLMYISGNDSRLPELADGGTDVNILVVINPVDHQVLMINTPRDYYVVNPASGDGSGDKLSHLGLHGIENCITAMSDLYGHEIDYYARINFSGFRTLIDALGGVTVYSEKAFAFTNGGFYFNEGENHLNGAAALAFARERMAFLDGDNQRGKNQMALIKGMINQLSADNIIANYSAILDSLEGMFATTLTSQEIGMLVDMQLTDMPSWDILTFSVTGENGSERCWAVGGGYGYVMYPHEYMVEHASELIGRVLAGEVLTEDDLVVEVPNA